MKRTHPEMALVINFSGGKDSTAMLATLCERYPDVKKYVVMADTGFEHTKHVAATEWARQIVARFGLELHIVRNANKTFLSMIAARHQARPDAPCFPSPSLRQCTSDLKRDPIATWIRRNVKERLVINCTGIRAEESASRAKRHPLTRNVRLSKAGRVVWDWAPIHKWLLGDVLKLHEEKQLPLHPVYVYAGGYLSRFSCRLCVMMKDEEIRAVYQHDREAFDAMAQLEQSTGWTMKNGTSLVQIISVPGAAIAQHVEGDCAC